MSTAWPQVSERLVTLFRSVTQAPVYDGPPVTSAAPPDYVTVGYVEDDVAGSWLVESIYDGNSLQETGTVVSQVVAQSGDTNLAACRSRVFAVADALNAAVRADHTLGGVLSPDSACTLSTDVLSVQNPNGSAQSLLLTLSYSTRY